MVLEEIIRTLEKEFPIELAEEWDNTGHIIGDKKDIINRVQISLDLTESVLNNAIENGVDLIITHHPPIFSSLKKINDSSLIGRKILKLIRHGINVYSLHTNLDSAKEGLNQYVAEKLEGKNIKVLDPLKYQVYKLVFFTPKKEYDKIKKILETDKNLEFNGYENVFYESEVIENIKGQDKIGSIKVEVIGQRENVNNLLNKIRAKYSYDEMAYEIIKLENNYTKNVGLGRVFEVEESNLERYIDFVKEKFALEKIKYVKSNNNTIKKVAVVNGSGASFWKKAKNMKVDLFITGDVKYHEGLDAFENDLNLIDFGHYESEVFFNEIIIKKLSDKLEIDVYNEKRIFEIR